MCYGFSGGKPDDGSDVKMEKVEEELTVVRVKTMDSKELVIKLEADKKSEHDGFKVKDLKAQIASLIKLEVSRQRLIFQGKLLKDNDKLQDYNVGEMSIEVFKFTFMALQHMFDNSICV